MRWRPCWRIIPSRFPPVDLYARVAPPEDRNALDELEGRTNERLRDERGEVALIAPADRAAGPGAQYVMAAFAHVNPEGSRFADGSYGVYYAARELPTAIAETVHHREVFLRRTNEAAIRLEMRLLAADLDGRLHDIRGLGPRLPGVLDPGDYAAGRALGRSLRDAGSSGIAYDSVRRAGGQCAAVFRPRVVRNCRQERHLCYAWDGARIAEVFEMRAVEGFGRG